MMTPDLELLARNKRTNESIAIYAVLVGIPVVVLLGYALYFLAMGYAVRGM